MRRGKRGGWEATAMLRKSPRETHPRSRDVYSVTIVIAGDSGAVGMGSRLYSSMALQKRAEQQSPSQLEESCRRTPIRANQVMPALLRQVGASRITRRNGPQHRGAQPQHASASRRSRSDLLQHLSTLLSGRTAELVPTFPSSPKARTLAVGLTKARYSSGLARSSKVSRSAMSVPVVVSDARGRRARSREDPGYKCSPRPFRG